MEAQQCTGAGLPVGRCSMQHAPSSGLTVGRVTTCNAAASVEGSAATLQPAADMHQAVSTAPWAGSVLGSRGSTGAAVAVCTTHPPTHTHTFRTHHTGCPIAYALDTHPQPCVLACVLTGACCAVMSLRTRLATVCNVSRTAAVAL